MDWTLFKRAIADIEDPTPGYMYRDMAQWTFKDYSTQMKFINALFDKLKPNGGVYTLHKVLRIIKIMCETGHSDFQKEMQKNNRTEIIKTFAIYRGKPDARHGDNLNEKVRQASRDAMEAIFTHRKEEQLPIEAGYGNTNNNNNNNNNSSMLKSTFTTGYVTTGENIGGVMGSSNIAPMPTTNKWAEHMAQQAAAANISTTSRILSSLTEKAKTGFGILSNSESSMNYKSAKEQLYESALKLSTTGTTTTNSLGTLNTNDSGNFKPVELSLGAPLFSNSEESTSSGWKFIEEVGKSDETIKQDKNGSNSQHILLQQQQQLTPFQVCIQNLCQLKSTPQRVELHSFVERCCELGTEMIQQRMNHYQNNNNNQELNECWEELAEAIDTQLSNKHPWQRRLNALVALEAIIISRSDNSAISSMQKGVIQYFSENPEDVQRNVYVVQATLREKAQRVVKLLGLPERDENNNNNNNNNIDNKVNDSASFSPTRKANQVQSAGNKMDSFSWSAPIQQMSVDMSGMSVKANSRIVKDKTTLKKRAPIRLSDEEDWNIPDNNNNNNIIINKSNNKQDEISHSSNNGNNVFDELFGEGSTISIKLHTAPVSNSNTSSGQQEQQQSINTTVGNNNNNLTAFDFLLAGNREDMTQSLSQSQVQAESTQYLPLSTHDESTSSLLFSSNSVRDVNNNGDGISRVNNNNNNIPISTFEELTISPSSSPASSNIGVSTEVILQMQQQLQSLMSDIQRNSSPAALSQLQTLMAQQQQLMTLLTQHQQLQVLQNHEQQQQQQHQQMMWNNIPSNTETINSISNVKFPTHNHFTIGATPTVHSNSPSTSSNTFADVQQEMIARLTAPKSK